MTELYAIRLKHSTQEILEVGLKKDIARRYLKMYNKFASRENKAEMVQIFWEIRDGAIPALPLGSQRSSPACP